VDITLPNISALNVGVSTKYNFFLAAAKGFYEQVATVVDSDGASEAYPRLDMLPGIREWLGDRVIRDISVSNYTLVNRTFEQTVGIRREDIEDDRLGLLNLAVQQLGQNVGEFPDRLVWQAADVAQSTIGPDGQYFFDVDHASWDASGASISVANYQSGSSPAWYLMDLSKPVRPFIFQRRRPFALQPRIALDNPNVFYQRRFEWGVDGRCAAGYGMWQLAFKSKAALTPANYAAARTAMMTWRRPDGQPLNVTPTHLVFPPSLRGDANTLIKNMLVTNTAGTATLSNPWLGTAELLEVPYIT
jgi:phage major head subunit gpT-like protein